MPTSTTSGPRSAFVISITPFTEVGALDEDGFRSHLQRMAAAGIGVYVGGGGSGEGYTLDDDETRRVVEVAVDELKGVVPVRAMGVEPRDAAAMVRYVRMADACGADACQVYSLDQGHGHRPSEREIETYFTDVMSAVDSPCVVSTHQSVGYQVPVPMLERLLDRFEHVVGINCSHQDVGYVTRVVDAVGDRATVHVGGPIQALLVLSLGGHGFLSSEANLAPHLCASVIHAADRGDGAAMLESFGKVVRLFNLLYGHGGIRATKAVLTGLGLPGGVPRKPQLPVADEVADRVLEAVRELDLAGLEGWSQPAVTRQARGPR